MSTHEITTGDVFNLVQEVRDSVIKIEQQVGSMVAITNDHEERLRKVEELRAVGDTVKHQGDALEDLKRKVYQFSGAATVLGALSGTVISKIIGS